VFPEYSERTISRQVSAFRFMDDAGLTSEQKGELLTAATRDRGSVSVRKLEYLAAVRLLVEAGAAS
jgi:hypothetical protein